MTASIGMSMTEIGQAAPRRHRGLFWTSVLVALALIVAGGLLVTNSYARTTRPADVVERYFGALERGDAPGALALGTVPAGSRGLLTSDVLQFQQEKVAHIRQVSILSSSQHGSRASVTVQYQLVFPDGPQLITDTVPVVQRGRLWRLENSAVPMRLHVLTARDRATLAGAALTSKPVLAFPGAPPIKFDTPLLAVVTAGKAPVVPVIRFSGSAPVSVDVGVSQQGQASLSTTLDSAIRACLTGQATDPLCPAVVDGRRIVPGTLRGTLIGSPSLDQPELVAGSRGDWGLIDLTGKFRAKATFTALDFNNIATTQGATVDVNFDARVLATQPDKIVWQAS